jgi:NAD(P)-dependent dehydrogenase (short-subunit alcohol dehydrogenase family)
VTSARPIAVVTGASRGIGRATALALAERGMDIALLARSPGDLDEAARAVAERGVRSLPVPCDVMQVVDVDRASLCVLGELGVPHVVVNNAGSIKRGLVANMTADDFRWVIDANLTSTFLVTRAFLPRMLEQKAGRIVQVGSISSTLGTAGASAYCAAKWGVVGFTKSLAEELRGTGLVTLAVLPGSVDTDMLEGSGFVAQMSPEDVARVIVYAALDAPAAMNASSIEVFGP